VYLREEGVVDQKDDGMINKCGRKCGLDADEVRELVNDNEIGVYKEKNGRVASPFN